MAEGIHDLQGRGAIGVGAEQLDEDLVPVRGPAVLEDLLHHVAGELVLGKLKAVRAQLRDRSQRNSNLQIKAIPTEEERAQRVYGTCESNGNCNIVGGGVLQRDKLDYKII